MKPFKPQGPHPRYAFIQSRVRTAFLSSIQRRAHSQKKVLLLNMRRESSLILLSGPFDHGFWRAVQEDEFRVHVLLQVQFTRLSDQEDVHAQFEDAVHVGQLFEHDGVRDSAKELSHELSDNQNHRHVQSHDPVHKLKQLMSHSSNTCIFDTDFNLEQKKGLRTHILPESPDWAD